MEMLNRIGIAKRTLAGDLMEEGEEILAIVILRSRLRVEAIRAIRNPQSGIAACLT